MAPKKAKAGRKRGRAALRADNDRPAGAAGAKGDTGSAPTPNSAPSTAKAAQLPKRARSSTVAPRKLNLSQGESA